MIERAHMQSLNHARARARSCVAAPCSARVALYA
jgi:hypothetical protein